MPAAKKIIWLSPLCILLILCSGSSFAQLNFEFTEGKFLIKGQVSDLKTEQTITNANIWITNQKKGITADVNGNFAMYVYPTDTLRFSSLGYIQKTIPVSAIPDRDKYTMNIQLVPDIYSLKAVTIYPFHDRDEFILAFLKGPGTKPNIQISGIDPPKYIHKEKAKFYNPISAIFNQVQKNRSSADPDFKP
jgi:hypothetical protein